MNGRRPWQLEMFRKGLKKNLRLKSLRRVLGELQPSERCLLITCGDNNGAMNYFLRELGGQWSWADLEDHSIPEMAQLLGDPVAHVRPDSLPFDSKWFDRVISIDVHEHIDDPASITRELTRVAKIGAQIIITVPNGDESKLAVRIKNAVGMTKEVYGHKRLGLTVTELREMMLGTGIQLTDIETYTRFFTELLELTINFAYVKLLNRAGDTIEEHTEIAPASKDDFASVRRTYRLYSLIFPLYWLVSRLDYLILWREGYCVLIAGCRRSA